MLAACAAAAMPLLLLTAGARGRRATGAALGRRWDESVLLLLSGCVLDPFAGMLQGYGWGQQLVGSLHARLLLLLARCCSFNRDLLLGDVDEQ